MKEIVESRNINNHHLATVFHDSYTKKVVVFCHGYRGTSIGPSRFFVKTARQLSAKKISSLRFDQYGSGNSEGDFFDSSFFDWISTLKSIATDYQGKGYKVAFFGQSMGASAVIVAGSEIDGLTAVIAWAPDPSVDDFTRPESGMMEEGGQRVQSSFWEEAHRANISDKLSSLECPAYIVQCTADEYVDDVNRKVVMKNAQPHHIVENFEGYPHSKWSYDQAEEIINKSVSFLSNNF